MNRLTAIDPRRFSIPLVLGWLCALSPFAVLLVIRTAWLQQQAARLTVFGPFADHYRIVMLAVLHVGWSLSLMFAAYVAGPLCFLLLCTQRWRSGWKVHGLQVITCGVGWVLVCILILQSDLLSTLG